MTGVTVSPVNGNAKVDGIYARDLQSGVHVGTGDAPEITGTLTYYNEGGPDEEGYYLALEFSDIDEQATSVIVNGPGVQNLELTTLADPKRVKFTIGSIVGDDFTGEISIYSRNADESLHYFQNYELYLTLTPTT